MAKFFGDLKSSNIESAVILFKCQSPPSMLSLGILKAKKTNAATRLRESHGYFIAIDEEIVLRMIIEYVKRDFFEA